MSPAPTSLQSSTVALVGRQNSGKTSLLMHLTGTPQRPINFPGTSVERVESSVAVGDRTLRIVDLPGIGSLHAVSRDEEVTLQYLLQAGGPDVLCVVLDATKLSLELRLLQQLRSRGRPIVVALSKLDIAAAEGRPVAVEALGRALGLPLVAVDGLRGTGMPELRRALADAAAAPVAAGPLASETSPDVLAAAVQPAATGRRTSTDRFDAVLLHPVLGLLALALVLLAAFQLVFTIAEPVMRAIEAGQAVLGAAVRQLLPAGALQSFVADGLINGLGSVLAFVPQIALLIAFVTLLESSGYMARAVFLLDRVLRRVGLSGKSFLPLASSFGCAIPGILSSRILTDERDRIATVVVAPLMSCSARLPVYVVLLGAFFPPQQAGLVLFLLYALGVVVAFAVAFVLRRTVLRGGASMLAMELPVYQRPNLRVVTMQVWLSVRAFLQTAGTVILTATVVVWALSYWPRPADVTERFAALRAEVPADSSGDGQREELQRREQAACLERSWLASIGKTIQPVFAPAGFDWRMTVGILAAFPARELIVPTLGTLHSQGALDPSAVDFAGVAAAGLRRELRAARDEQGRPTMNSLVALALMAFFALCSQCASTLAAIRRETHGWRWPVFTFSYMTALAWIVAVGIYQVGSWLGYGLPR